MITLCMQCDQVTKVQLLTSCKGLSHGICLDCMPKWFKDDGFTDDEIDKYMENYRRREIKK